MTSRENFPAAFSGMLLRRAVDMVDYLKKMPQDVYQANIKGVMPTSNGCAIFLEVPEKTFVIYVDQGIGQSLSMAINEVKKERPLTHDLITSMLTGLDAQLKHILINDVDEGTFYARILLEMENELGRKVLEIDARPSDSLVLAVQAKAPIYVSKQVTDKVEDMAEILERILKQQDSSS